MFFFGKKNQKTFFWRGVAVLAGWSAAASAAQVPLGLGWAYPLGHAALPAIPAGINHVQGSTVGIAKDALDGDAHAPDWFPAAHPAPPAVVSSSGPHRDIGCASCHFINGQGFPGSADLAGLPAAYIIEQVHAFQTGRRRSSQAERTDTLKMIEVVRNVSDAELAAAAAYFAALPKTYRFDVVEAAMVPHTEADDGWLDLAPGGTKEPIAARIIEVPRDALDMEREDPNARMVAYVPRGAIARGLALARGGDGRQACSQCHGAALQGSAMAPRIAGRSPAYVARMLWDIKTGARGGPEVALMRPVVAGLSAADVTDLAAYLCAVRDGTS